MITEKEFTIEGAVCSKNVTVYQNPDVPARAAVLYFHGGGLLYGSRTDLPLLHRKMLTEAGCVIIAYDYPLAPAAKLDVILQDVTDSINHYIAQPEFYGIPALPFFLWGRSAGAYLCLLAAAKGTLTQMPVGVLSYYGYGILCDNWFQIPSRYYNTLPKVPESCLNAAPDEIHSAGNLDTHYSIYVYARQTGAWKSLFFDGRDKFFYLDYSLRTCDKFPCPLFCTHSINDTDVPYSEFLELCGKYNPKRFVASRSMHDFDRVESDPITVQLLETTLLFINEKLSNTKQKQSRVN